MTRSELIDLVEKTFGSYGIKIVSATDVSKSAYIPNIKQKQIFESFGIDSLDRRNDIEIKELFTDRVLIVSYYASQRIGANRTPEVRIGLTDLISYISVGDEILFTHDNNNIFIYNLSNLNNESKEENLYSQIDIELLREKADSINTKPSKIEQTIKIYPRSNLLRAYIKERANYSCELPDCDYIGFDKNNGKKYIEIHHLVPLSEGGEDSIINTIALCPTCHRKIHYAKNKEELKQKLKKYLDTLE